MSVITIIIQSNSSHTKAVPDSIYFTGTRSSSLQYTNCCGIDGLDRNQVVDIRVYNTEMICG